MVQLVAAYDSPARITLQAKPVLVLMGQSFHRMCCDGSVPEAPENQTTRGSWMFLAVGLTRYFHLVV